MIEPLKLVWKSILETFIKICYKRTSKLTDQSILFSNALTASLWHHFVLELSKIARISDFRYGIPQSRSKIPELFETKFKSA